MVGYWSTLIGLFMVGIWRYNNDKSRGREK